MEDDILSYMMGSRYRLDVLLALYQKKMTVNQMSDFLHINTSYLYTVLSGLKKRKLVTHNDVARHQIYRITDDGIKVLREIGVL